MDMEFSFVDLFGAPGGLSLGFKMASFSSLATVDFDAAGLRTYHRNFPKSKIISKNIRDVKCEWFLAEVGMSKGECDVLLGGPPCQGFSSVGRVKIASLVRGGIWKLKNGNSRLIDDPRNLLYKEFLRFVEGIHPAFFVLENVLGIMSYRNGEIVREIVQGFEDLGYRTDFKILDAAEYGVPQHRRRVFFIGNERGSPNPFPKPTHCTAGIESLGKSADGGDIWLPEAITVWDAIADLPRIRAGVNKSTMNYTKDPCCEYQKWARKGSEAVYNHVTRPHGKRDRDVFKKMKPGNQWKDLPKRDRRRYGYRDDVFTDKFKRLWKNKPAWTITSHIHKDGYVYIHPTQTRTVSVREAARLQSFPDTFVFEGSRTEQFRQVGNAVPPLMARAIAMEIRKVLEKHRS